MTYAPLRVQSTIPLTLKLSEPTSFNQNNEYSVTVTNSILKLGDGVVQKNSTLSEATTIILCGFSNWYLVSNQAIEIKGELIP